MTYLEKNFSEKILKLKNFKQKLRHQAMGAQALRVEAKAETIQKLPLPHSRLRGLNDVIFYDVIKNSDKQVFQQLIVCAAAYLAYLRGVFTK